MPIKEKAKLDVAGLSNEDFVDVMNKHFGPNTLALASKALGLKLNFLSTGVYGLDFGLGGGVPENRVTEIHGPFSSLKSTLMYNVTRNFQRKYKDGMAVIEDGEKSFDPAYAKLCGVKLDRLLLINADSGEQAVDAISHVLDVGRPLLLGVDSIASLVPAAEIDSSMDQNFQGLHPRLIARMMRRVVAAMKRSLYDSSAASTTVLATNQIREKIGVMYGSPETTPGGRAKDFYYSVIIKFRSSPSDRIMIKETRNGIERERRVGQSVHFTVTKNKVSSSQFEEGDFEYYVRPYKGHKPFSFNNEDVLFRFGVFYGIVQPYSVNKKTGGKSTRYKYDELDSSEVNFRKGLIEHPDVAKGLYREILSAVLEEDQGVMGQVPTSVESD